MASFNLHFSSASIWNDLNEEIKSLSLRLFKQYMTKQSVSIKHGLRTTDSDYGLGIKHGLGIKRGLSITDWV